VLEQKNFGDEHNEELAFEQSIREDMVIRCSFCFVFVFVKALLGLESLHY